MPGLDDAIPWICLNCGETFLPVFYSASGLCPKCEHKDMLSRITVKYYLMRKNGWIPESRRKAGRKAYETRIARLSVRNPDEYEKIMKKIVGKGEVLRARRIRRKAKKYDNETHYQVD